MEIGEVSDAWEQHALEWLTWARTPDLDVYYEHMNLPVFAKLVAPPGRRTLEVGCGEGRIGRWLSTRGHRVSGIDRSPTLAEHARAAGGYEQVVHGDTITLPWPDDHFDFAVAFMSLHDMPDPGCAIAEIARVLEHGGRLCIVIIHPLDRRAEHQHDYFTERVFSERVDRDEHTMTFVGVGRPLEAYTRALANSGFVIEELCEPRPTAAVVECIPALAPAAARPHSLQLRCRLE
jgi:SAM-dependent methyltransferase